MSTIRKEGDLWYYYARIGRQQIHRSLQTGDKRTAQDRQKQLDLELAGKKWIDSRMSWEDFCMMYKEWSASRKPHGTARNERLALEKITAVLAPARLKDITRAQAEHFITVIMRPDANGHATTPAGANWYIRTLRSICSQAKAWRLLEENPFSGIAQLSFDLPAPRILTRAEIARLFAALQKHAPDYVPLIAFYLVTGMRRNEALHLEWQHVNFESGVIIVARAKGRRPRLIPLSPPARRILEARKGMSRPFEWYPSSINRMWLRVRKEAGVPDVKIHDLRKTFGTLLAQAGVSSLLIQNWMGHTDPTVTREHYIGLPEETKKQLGGLERVLPAGILKRPKHRNKTVTTLSD